MELKRLSIRDPKLQAFVWEHLDPIDIRWDYTQLDAIQEVARREAAGECEFWGDLSVPVVFRAEMANPKVLEPHVMGDGRFMRSALEQGVPIAWAMGVEVIRIWTQHEQIARIVERCGFAFEAEHRDMLMDADGRLLTVYSLTLRRSEQCSI